MVENEFPDFSDTNGSPSANNATITLQSPSSGRAGAQRPPPRCAVRSEARMTTRDHSPSLLSRCHSSRISPKTRSEHGAYRLCRTKACSRTATRSDPDAIVSRRPKRRSTQSRPSFSITYFVTVGSADDHHAFHQDAEPGDLGLQLLPIRSRSSVNQLRTITIRPGSEASSAGASLPGGTVSFEITSRSPSAG